MNTVPAIARTKTKRKPKVVGHVYATGDPFRPRWRRVDLYRSGQRTFALLDGRKHPLDPEELRDVDLNFSHGIYFTQSISLED